MVVAGLKPLHDLSLQRTLADSFHKKNEPERIKQASAFIVIPFIGKFLKDEVKLVKKGAGLRAFCVLALLLH